MTAANSQELRTLVSSLRGLGCWYVSCGGAVGPSFQLALGGKVRRERPLKNPSHPAEFREFRGEANLLVWCSWRLDSPDTPLTSSDDSLETIERELPKLVGATVDSVSLTAPAWDLELCFSNGLRLWIFCDHVPGDPSFDGNWQLSRYDVTAYIGPGARHVIEKQTSAQDGASLAQDQPAAGKPDEHS